jgi:5'(3')-deoxyribonucleotidase
MRKRRRAFLDMDGVLADFDGAVLSCLDISWPQLKKKWGPGLGHTIHEGVGMTWDQLELVINAPGGHFWRSMNTYPWTHALLKRCQEIAPTCILSTPPSNPEVVQHKAHWLKLHFGKNFQDYLFGEKKHFVAAPGHLLIDDAEKNCKAWEKAGGEAILFPQYTNRLHRIWKAGKAYQYVLKKLGD